MIPTGGRAAALASAVFLAAAVLPAGPPPADLVVVNGRVLTMDARQPVAQAAAVRDGVFVAVGRDAEVRALVGPSTRVVDARGRSVLPGLIDSHVHALMVAEAEARGAFRDLRSIGEIQDWFRERAAAAAPGTWLWSPRVFPTRLRERRLPTREELDAAAPRHAVAVDAAYAFVLNTAALAAAGIGPDTAAPAGGAIVKDAAGRPTGLLRNVGGLLDRYRPEARPERLLDALEQVHARYLAAGITSVIERLADPPGYRAYAALHDAGRLRVRATVTIRVAADGSEKGTEAFLDALPFRFGEGDDRLRVGPLKIFADGGILAGTAFMREPYGETAAALYGQSDPAYRGFLTLTPEQMKTIVRAAHRRGWPMVAHVTGDAGVDAVLDAFAAADADRPIRDRRFTLLHAYFPHEDAARRAAALGVAVDTQPAWYYKDADALLPALGAERMRRFIGLREWLRAGVTVALNTDHMFGLDPDRSLNPYNPFLTMGTAVTRLTEGGQVMGPEQAVSREEALRMMTRDAAFLSFDEGRKGSIETGKLGDLVVLSGDFQGCPPEKIRELRAVVTVLGGKVVHQADGE
jgi:predicted amidohydrolase YtcJ